MKDFVHIKCIFSKNVLYDFTSLHFHQVLKFFLPLKSHTAIPKFYALNPIHVDKTRFQNFIQSSQKCFHPVC